MKTTTTIGLITGPALLAILFGLVDERWPRPVASYNSNPPSVYVPSNVLAGYIDYVLPDDLIDVKNTVPKGPPGTNERVHEINFGPRYQFPHYQAPDPSEILVRTRTAHQYVLVHSTNCPCLKPEAP